MRTLCSISASILLSTQSTCNLQRLGCNNMATGSREHAVVNQGCTDVEGHDLGGRTSGKITYSAGRSSDRFGSKALSKGGSKSRLGIFHKLSQHLCILKRNSATNPSPSHSTKERTLSQFARCI